MHGLGLKFCVLLAALTWMGCAPVKSTATDYKERLGTGVPGAQKPGTTTGQQQPATSAPAPGNTGAPAAASGNAQSGLAILTANCETSGCHKDNGRPLTKISTIDEAVGAKPAHRGVQPVFSPTNIADIKAALAGR